MTLRLLVCGGRDYADPERVYRELDARLRISLVLFTGGCPSGADAAAQRWAELRGIPCAVVPAAWPRFGPGAGPIRNQWIINHFPPDRVLAFPGGRGTADMVARARKAGIPVEQLD